MPDYTYTGDEGRYYPTLGLTPEPGDVLELDRNPGDGRWTPPDPEPEQEQDEDQVAAQPLMEPVADPATGATEITGDGSGTALPPVDPADPGPRTAPARMRTRTRKEA
ncbi:hypothetical protein ACEZCY_14720 [Streptacidiphilus sp. N1-12]|uniref:Uncharacterized protein n=2 Tax=Streptacidiphilus alkalitolerans TaxID=3342712 RepID=A0ABV6WEM3_9ACTN